MIDPHLRTLTAAIVRHQSQRRRRNVRFPASVRRDALAYARRQRAAGATLQRIASDLGVATNTLDRWLKIEPEKKFRPVSVRGTRPANRAKAALVLHGPVGLRVEGLDPEAVAAILRALA
jgi:predicted transcriptional regulator